MIPLVQNITSVQQIENLKLTEVTASGKPLPAKNSIVNINILGKSEGNYRLLVDGRVFQASLPVIVNAGDTLLAKVINTNPFTLSLDQLIAKTMNESVLSQLLMKLGIKNSAGAKRLLKVLAEIKKPVIKSKFEKLLDLFEKENLKLSDDQLGFYLQVLSSNEQQYENPDRSFAALFESSSSQLAGRIFNSVKNLQSRQLPAELKKSVEEAFIIDAGDTGAADGLMLKNKNSAQMHLVNQLQEALGDKKMPEQLKIEVFELLNSLALFMMYKANSSRIGRFPEFMIIRGEDGLELFEYEFNLSELQKNFRSSFDLNMKPEQLGIVNINGFVSGNNLKADFTSANDTKNELEAAAAELENDLKNSLRLNPVLKFITPESGGSGKKGETLRGINVSV